MSTEDCISDLFLWVASMMTDAPKRPDARLHPSDLVTWRCASRSRAWGRAPSTHGCARTTVTTVGRAPLVTGLGGSRSGPSMRYVGRRRGRWRAYHARKAGRCLDAWWLRTPAHGQPPLCRSAPSTCHTYARISHAGCSGCDRRAQRAGKAASGADTLVVSAVTGSACLADCSSSCQHSTPADGDGRAQQGDDPAVMGCPVS